MISSPSRSNYFLPWSHPTSRPPIGCIVVTVELCDQMSPSEPASPLSMIVGMTDDMVGEGLAASMARPGGHTTGVSIMGAQLDVKRLELLHEFVPQARRIAVLK